MKKLSLILILAVALVSCNNDDDGPSIAYSFAPITGNNLPDYFEVDEDYDVNVTYRLENSCHTFNGFTGGRVLDNDVDSTLIFEAAVQTNYDPNITDCSEEGSNLVQTKNLLKDLNISKITGYKQFKKVRFRLLKGANASNPNQGEFDIVDIPIGAPEATPEPSPDPQA